jgi:hypothetical protein
MKTREEHACLNTVFRRFCRIAVAMFILSLSAAAEPPVSSDSARAEACSIPVEFDHDTRGYSVIVPVSLRDVDRMLNDFRDPRWMAWADAYRSAYRHVEFSMKPRKRFVAWQSRNSTRPPGSWTIEEASNDKVVLVERMVEYGRVSRTTISYRAAPAGVRVALRSEELPHRNYSYKGLYAVSEHEEIVLKAIFVALMPSCWPAIPQTQCRPVGCRHNEHCERSPATFKPRCVGDIRPCGPTTCTTWNEECRVLETGFQCVKDG